MIARLLPPARREWAVNVFVGSVTVTAAVLGTLFVLQLLALGLRADLRWLLGVI